MIRPLDPSEVDAFLPHAERHAGESGDGTTIRYSLRVASDPWDEGRLRHFLHDGLRAAVDSPGWCRVWIFDGPPEIRGNVALRAHAQPESSHRALVSIGVLAPYRRSGIGSELLKTAITWAANQGTLEWLDAESFGHNEPALNLHHRLGFVETARAPDMFRLDGTSVDDVRLSLRLRRP